ncbi:MAG: alpha/beta hydrolase family protein [Candidatus Humimicrobiaceae bacterium]
MEKEAYFYSGGIRLYGIFTIPEFFLDKSKKAPLIVMSHGYGASADEFGDYKFLAQKLQEAGIASFRFNNRGCGESEYPLGRMLCSTEWKDDLISAVNFVSSFPGIDADKIGLFGESMGGANVIHAGALENISKCVVALSAISDGYNFVKGNWLRNKSEKEFNEFLKIVNEDSIRESIYGKSNLTKMSDALPYPQRYSDLIETLNKNFEDKEFTYYVEIASIASIFQLKPIEFAGRVSPKPLLIMAGRKDGVVPWEENSKLLFEKAKEIKEFKLFENGDHGLLAEPTKTEAIRMIIDWFKKYL